MVRISAVLLVLLIACTAGGEPAPTEPDGEAGPAPTSPDEPAEPETLIYLKRASLMSLDIASGRREVLQELPSGDASVSPDTSRLVVVEETSPLGSTEEGFRAPGLLIGPTGGAGLEELGPGRSPLWSPDGEIVAAIMPTAGEACADAETEGTGCPAREQVVIFDPDQPGAPEDVVTQPALGYSLLGWSGGDVFALRAPGESVLGDQELPFSPSEVWGVSPTGGILLQVDDAGARITRIDAATARAEIDLDGAQLGQGAWSPDGSTVAAVLIKPSGARVFARLAFIDANSGALTIVPGSEGAQGNVVWTADSSSFGYVRVDPDDARKLQAVMCTAELKCRGLFNFPQGVRLLGLN